MARPERYIREEISPSTPLSYGGFWIRFFALLIDTVVFVVGFGILNVALRMVIDSNLLAMGMNVVALVAGWLYFAYLESSPWQATLGKKALHLKVVNLQGQRISFGRASARYFSKILSGLILCIGYIMAGFTQKKQALHDLLVGTYVIRS